MKAVVVGPLAHWAISDVADGWVAGLRELGVQTAHFDTRSQLSYFLEAKVGEDQMGDEQARRAVTINLFGDLYDLDPDVVFIVTGRDVFWPMIARIRCPVVLILTEHPYEREAQAIAASDMDPDLILVNDPVGSDVYQQIAPTFYLPHAYRPDVHYPSTDAKDIDAIYVATGFPNRVELLEKVDWSGIDMTLGGMWYGVDEHSPLHPFLRDGVALRSIPNTELADLYRRAVTGFNIYRDDSHGEHSNADGWAVGPREIEMSACGLWHARHARPEGDELFPMLPSFTEAAELGDLLRWALEHPDERQAAADAARAAITDRTFAANATKTLKRLGL